AHPQAHLWDNGEDAVAELDRVLKIRETALNRFSEANIARGAAMSSLEEVLVPVYFFHRYQTEAAAKVLGGLHYTYAVRGDSQTPVRFVDASLQFRALDALIKTIRPDTLTLPEHILAIVPPRAHGATRHRETFGIRTGLTLDPVTLAESAADFTVGLLLHSARAARLLEHHARDESQPSLHRVLDTLLDATWGARTESGLHGEVQRAVRYVVLKHLMSLAASPDAAPQVRATADSMLTGLVGRLGRRLNQDVRIQARYAEGLIEQYRNTPERFVLESPPALPPGSPIGFAPGQFCSFSAPMF
ncbi:MAG: zinc-dependent metalloprotease, partial [Candidatus Hydrogenedentes bacterium]|nr:zinc-dependent metalloprotease [Candidatus Hydrogenedentota bacterium]